MDTKVETEKRLKIAKEITAQVKDIARGVMLGGSMGYGQNYAVTDKSDIDLLIAIDIENLDQLVTTPFFKNQVPEDIVELFKRKEINFFWVTKIINSIEVNVFIYESETYTNFCLIKGDLKGYIVKKPESLYETADFEGIKHVFDRKVQPHKKGFLYERPCFAEGKYWGDVPREDFFYSNKILYEKELFFTKLEKEVWRVTIKQLLKEYGNNPNLNKVNILNTHWVYRNARHKLPLEVIEKIKRRTEEEFKKLKLQQ